MDLYCFITLQPITLLIEDFMEIQLPLVSLLTVSRIFETKPLFVTKSISYNIFIWYVAFGNKDLDVVEIKNVYYFHLRFGLLPTKNNRFLQNVPHTLTSTLNILLLNSTVLFRSICPESNLISW